MRSYHRRLFLISLVAILPIFSQVVQNNWRQFDSQKSPYQVYLEVEEENNRITDKTTQNYDQTNNQWINSGRSTYSYAYYGNYNRLQYYYYYYYSNGWIGAYYYYYNYDALGYLTAYDYYGYYNGAWEQWGTGEYSNHNANGDWGTETYTNISSNSGNESTQTDRHFDNDGNVTDVYDSYWNGSSYTNYSWVNTTWNNGYQDQMNYYDWNYASSTWDNSWQYTYNYNNGYNSQVSQAYGYLYSGSPTSWTGYNWYNGGWSPYQYCAYGFNNGYTTSSTNYGTYDSATNTWATAYARSYFNYYFGAGKVANQMDISDSRLMLVENKIPGATEGEWIDSERTWLSYENNTVSTEDVKSVPTSIALKQNRPNPFNPSTVIEFTIDKNSDVVLSIYDITGKLINELTNKKYPVGVHSVKWNGTDLYGERVSSGFYIYALEANETIITKKMIMLN